MVVPRVMRLGRRGMLQPETDRHLEEALARAEAAEANYRSLAELVPRAITYTEDLDSGRVFAVSPHVEKILGYTPEEWIGDASLWIDRIHPDDRAGSSPPARPPTEPGSRTAWSIG